MQFHLISQLWQYFPKKRKLHFFYFLLSMILASCAEVISIGSLVPFLAAITNPELLSSNKYLGTMLSIFGFDSSNSPLLLITVIFCSAAIIAGSLRLVLLKTQINLSFKSGADIANCIFINSLNKPYIYHATKSSNETISGILSKSDSVIYHIILPFLTLVSSLTLAFFIILFLVFVSPQSTLLIFSAFATVYFCIAALTRSKTRENSANIAENSTFLLKVLQESFRGIREIYFTNSKYYFLDKFKKYDFKMRNAQASNSFISQSPKYIMEASGMVIISVFAYILTSTPFGAHNEISPLATMATIALSSQRLLPLLQHIYAAHVSINGYRSSLMDVLDLLKDSPPHPPSEKISLYSENILSLKNISFSYPGKENISIISNINLQVKSGETIGIFGHTGSGKSTLLDVLIGLLEPTEGLITFNNKNLNKANIDSYRTLISYVPQSIFLSDSSAYENIAFGIQKNIIDTEKAKNSAELAGIHNHIESLSQGYNSTLGEDGISLSGGQRQRLALARAFYRSSEILIFDEPTSALDDVNEQYVMDSIHKLCKGKIVFIVAHRLSTLKFCNRLIEVKNGALIEHQNLPT